LLLFIVVVVAYVISAVVGLIIGSISMAVAGPGGIPLVEHFFTALTGSALGVVVLALEAALYRHLQHQG
jgi:tetrahydromethanopterin S-methyltransferase subunit C